MEKMFYGTLEAANTLQVSTDTIYRMMKDGRINGACKIGNRVMIPAKEIEKYLYTEEEAEAKLEESKI